MNVGLLNRRITVEAPPTAKDDGGELTGSWTTFISAWAMVNDNSATEALNDGSDVMTTVRSFLIRYRSGVTNAMRVKHNNVHYQITGILEKYSGKFLELLTIQKSNWP